MKHALAIDLGASTGRAILGALDRGKLTLTEIHRFENLPRDAQGAFRWDLGALCKEIDAALAKVKEICVPDAIGIDTWGVDFGLLDEAGELLEEPLHYRDPSSIGMVESFCKRVCEKELYERTGLQLMRINSLFQLEAARLKRPEIFSRARKILMMPSLIARHLTGESKNEYTALSTSQLIDVRTKTPCEPVLNALGLTPDFCGTILKPGEIFGTLLPSYGLGAVPVVAVGMHDTASAVAAVPAEERDFIYISSGTWSLFGTELEQPVTTARAQSANLANEGGVFDKIRLLKNIMGLWLIQESRREYKRRGDTGLSFADLEREARGAGAFRSFILTDDPSFELPGDLPGRVAEYCQKTGQRIPDTRGEVIRCIYESLAMRYRQTLEDLEEVCGKRFSSIHIVGGGVKDDFLSQFTADATKKPVVAGPAEATATGNLMLQFYALGEVRDLAGIRKIVRESFPVKHFAPQDTELWDQAYQRYLAVTSKG